MDFVVQIPAIGDHLAVVCNCVVDFLLGNSAVVTESVMEFLLGSTVKRRPDENRRKDDYI